MRKVPGSISISNNMSFLRGTMNPNDLSACSDAFFGPKSPAHADNNDNLQESFFKNKLQKNL